MLFTRKGDNGTSGLFGTAERIPKDSPIYEALGTLDELNCLLGICRANCAEQCKSVLPMHDWIYRLQEHLFIIQAELAGANKAITANHVLELESMVHTIESVIDPLHSFIVPGGTELSGRLDYTRAVCRRAERRVVALTQNHPISPNLLGYLNRLSSVLYAMARYTAPTHKQHSPSY